MKTTIEIEIKNIDVDDMYYSFDYKVTINGILCEEDSYSNDYCNGDSPKEFKQYLKDGGAIQCVFDQFDFDTIYNKTNK